MESLAALLERRVFAGRLSPDRALASLDEAEAFLRGRGLLTRTADSALPSLYEACHEEAYQPGGQGFAAWPATKWPWFGALTGRGYLCVAGRQPGRLSARPADERGSSAPGGNFAAPDLRRDARSFHGTRSFHGPARERRPAAPVSPARERAAGSGQR